MISFQRSIYIAILCIAFGLRLGFSVYWHDRAVAAGDTFRLGDSHSYWTLAERIASGEPYQYGSENARIFRAPLYPIFLASFTGLGESSRAVLMARFAGSFLGTIAVCLLIVVATRIGGSCAGLAAGAIAACSPSAIGMSVIILSEAIFIPLMVLHLLLWQSAWLCKNSKTLATHSLLAGGVAGLAVLSRPSWLLFLPFASLWILLTSGERKRHALIIALSVAGICLVMSPWWIRNARITGHFVPTTLQVGPSLYDGLHDNATGASDEGMSFMQSLLAEQIEADQEATGPLDSTLEFRLNQRATRSAVAWANSHPTEVIRLAWNKFLRTWSVWPDGGDTGSTAIRFGLTIGSFGVLALALLATLRVIRPITWIAGICWMPCIYFTLLHMVFVGSVRYREPGVFVLSALAGCSLAWLAGCGSNVYPSVSVVTLQRKQGSVSVPDHAPELEPRSSE